MPNQIYHVTFTTAERRSLFHDLHLSRCVIRNLGDARLRRMSTTLCFVLMPDHMHWLLRLEEDATLSAVVGAFKCSSALAVNRRRNTPGTAVWSSGFHDRALRREDDPGAVARYIVANPVRAGLCRSERDWPHWDSAWEWDW